MKPLWGSVEINPLKINRNNDNKSQWKHWVGDTIKKLKIIDIIAKYIEYWKCDMTWNAERMVVYVTHHDGIHKEIIGPFTNHSQKNNMKCFGRFLVWRKYAYICSSDQVHVNAYKAISKGDPKPSFNFG